MGFKKLSETDVLSFDINGTVVGTNSEGFGRFEIKDLAKEIKGTTPTINNVEVVGDISLADLKVQSALSSGKLKDIIVIKTIEEYESLFGDEEYITSLVESMQEGDYILMFILDCDMGDGEKLTAISTMVMENGDLAFYDGFSTEIIDNKVNEALKPIRKQLEAISPTIDEKQDRSFTLEHNCEYRRLELDFLGMRLLQLLLPQNIPSDYIASLVFVSGENPTVFVYPDNIIFTGDDVVDNVLVPKANTTYNVMFWYDGINVNAISRGVPYAQE